MLCTVTGSYSRLPFRVSCFTTYENFLRNLFIIVDHSIDQHTNTVNYSAQQQSWATVNAISVFVYLLLSKLKLLFIHSHLMWQMSLIMLDGAKLS